LTELDAPSHEAATVDEAATWQRLTEHLGDALSLAVGERAAFVDKISSEEGPALGRRLRSLLALEEEAGDFLHDPVFRLIPEAKADPRLGQLIGAYRLVSELGRGGMGTVYLGERADGAFQKRVAVKILKRGMDSDEIVRRFEVERQILAGLDHENVARLQDGGTTGDGQPYFVLEYVAGLPIDQFCSDRNLPVRERLRLVLGVCEAVASAHRNLVIHRDLKPANILVTGTGKLKLLDFGIAKILSGDGEPELSLTTGTAPLTLRYASPEQVRPGPITTATDVYALGVLLHELVSESRPYDLEGLSRAQAEEAVCELPPVAPSFVSRPGLVPRALVKDLDTVVLKALHKDPMRRFGTVEQLAEDLRRLLAGSPVLSRPESFSYIAGKYLRRHRWRVVAAVVSLLSLISFSAVMAVQRSRIAQQAEEIALERDRAAGIKDFLLSFLRLPEPSRARGESLTVREAFETAATRLPETHPDLETQADLLDVFGNVFRNLRLLGEARPHLEAALEKRRQLFGNDHAVVASSLHNLALLERLEGRPDLAEALMQEGVEIQRRLFPEGGPGLATGLNNLASLRLAQEEIEEAKELAEEALAMKQGRGVPEGAVAYSLNTLGKIAWSQGDAELAKERFLEAVEIRRRVVPGSPELARSLNNLATVLMDWWNRPEEALPFYEESLDLRRSIYQSGSPQIAGALNNLGIVHLLLEEPGQAVEVLEEAWTIVVEKGGAGTSTGAAIAKHRALAIGEAGDPQRCEALMVGTLDVLRSVGSETAHPDGVSILGGCIAAQGRMEEAEPLLRESYEALMNLKDSTWRQTRQAEARLRRYGLSLPQSAPFAEGDGPGESQRKGAGE